jgi:Spy/CpxP family protein refolding chaperone
MMALVLVMGVGVAAAQDDQRGGDRRFGGDRGFGGGFFSDPLMLLGNERVQQELALVDDQLEELREVQDEAREVMQEVFRDMDWQSLRDLPEEERRAKFAEMQSQVEDRLKGVRERVNSVLLPHQQKRLEQLAFQTQSRRGPGGGLQTDSIADKLGLSEEQKTKLREAAEKAQANMEEKMQKLRQEMEDEILSVLTAEQRAQYKELMGEAFDFGTPRRGRDRGDDRGEDRRSERDF